MKYRKLSPTGDYTLGTGQDFYVNNPEAVAQAVSTRLKLFQGEWFLDIEDGTPWFRDVLGKYTKRTYDAVVRRRILLTEGVKSIVAFASVLNTETRTLVQTATIDTIYGVSSVENVVGIVPLPPEPDSSLVTVDDETVTAFGYDVYAEEA